MCGEATVDVMSERARNEPRHPIRVVSSRTGLSPSVLRAWERRYGAVAPTRSEGGQRLYTDGELRRLVLLARGVALGRPIGHLAAQSDKDLEGLIREDSLAQRVPDQARSAATGARAKGLLSEALDAVESLNGSRLDKVLMGAAVILDPQALVDEVMVPLLTRIGQLWEEGSLSPANERLASGVVRRFLEWVMGTIEVQTETPVMVCATPAGHHHELGALLSGVVGAGCGWHPVYLGPNLPGADIGLATRRLEARVLALSAIHPHLDPGIVAEFEAITRQLGRGVSVLAGGHAVQAVRPRLEAMGVRILDSYQELREHLTELAVLERQRILSGFALRTGTEE